MKQNYFTKGAQVIFHFEEWTKVLWSASGWGYVPRWKRAVVMETPRDSEGRFTNDYRYEDEVNVRLKDEDGKIFTTTLDNIEPNIEPSELSHEELIQLYGEISHGSMYYSDYRNNLGVFQNVAMDFYEGFYDSLRDEYGSEEEADKHDNAENFADYCEGCDWYFTPIAA